jgi:phage/plasmid-like protein (TIGR03299 family)
MAHELDFAANGEAAMAYVKGVSPWHSLGQELEPNAPIEVWCASAHMDWDIKRSVVEYRGLETGGYHMMPDKHVLYRSDSNKPLSIVSKNYKEVQPKQVLEFFRELTEIHGMKLRTAGVLFGGRRFWAMAEIGEAAHIFGETYMGQNLLLSTSCDGSLATTARLTSIDVVCNNTLSVAVRGGARVVRVPHNSVWDPAKCKVEMGLITESWNEFITNVRKLSAAPVKTTESGVQYLLNLLDPRAQPEHENHGDWLSNDWQGRLDSATLGTTDTCAKIFDLFAGQGRGATLPGRSETWWGMVSACTEYADYHTGHQTVDARLNSTWFGVNDKFKTQAMNEAMEQIAA